MKLKTEMRAGRIFVAGAETDGDATKAACADAAAAHALLQAIADAQEAEGLPCTLPHIAGFIQNRAADLMREWGFEEKVTP